MTTNTNFLTRMMQVLTDALERNAHQRTREYLLGLSDRHLDDMGLSRELLKQGPKAWPWSKPDESLTALRMHSTKCEGITDGAVNPATLERTHPANEQAVYRNPTETKLAA
jgi:uncharacterized protein YjiS (DUF1127 family)